METKNYDECEKTVTVIDYNANKLPKYQVTSFYFNFVIYYTYFNLNTELAKSYCNKIIMEDLDNNYVKEMYKLLSFKLSSDQENYANQVFKV